MDLACQFYEEVQQVLPGSRYAHMATGKLQKLRSVGVSEGSESGERRGN